MTEEEAQKNMLESWVRWCSALLVTPDAEQIQVMSGAFAEGWKRGFRARQDDVDAAHWDGRKNGIAAAKAALERV